MIIHLLFSDMIDGRAASTSVRTNRGFIDPDVIPGTTTLRDDVEGYTIRQIEDALKGKTHWTEWRLSITDSYTNATEANLETLFNSHD